MPSDPRDHPDEPVTVARRAAARKARWSPAAWRRRITRSLARTSRQPQTPPVIPAAVESPEPIDFETFDAQMRSWPIVSPERRRWLQPLSGVEPNIAEGLSRTRQAEDWHGFELYLLAAQQHPSYAYTRTLCELLDERREDMNIEEVAQTLFAVADPASVPSLARACFWWETSYDVARKAVWALDRIGTPDALAAIRELATGAPLEVADAAESALERADSEQRTFARLQAALPDGPPAPVSEEIIQAAEAQLGERIPRLLRRVYAELANGGWGPKYGAYGLIGGHTDDQGDDAVTVHSLLTQPELEFPDGWTLPRSWLPVLHAGCAMQYCVDCRSASGRTYLLDPGAGDPNGPVMDSVVWRCGSVEEFILAWLDGELPGS